ncbi:DUF6728 family protein [Roseivirga seohaensis]|uniref:Uncharacterized protein n=1 Tax=Roseivirga seohaensis subsp. aquiponti TaxID=1566026 RepID=A0A0L8AI81_9BACT|nr:DUF6728 family protein [Roseivirga seohaensis]KOF02059.1 hypothetical protein OB69_13565 [Roseivirga seohaensis subsp. aquiponti]
MSEEIKNEEQRDSKLTAKEAFNFGPVLGYFFRKKDPSRPTNFNIKAMHTINKISIIMFLIAVIVIVSRAIGRM